MKITPEEAIEYLENDQLFFANEKDVLAFNLAIASIQAWDDIIEKLKTIMEGDSRTFKNQVTDDGLYYDGIYDAIKIIEKYFDEVN